ELRRRRLQPGRAGERRKAPRDPAKPRARRVDRATLAGLELGPLAFDVLGGRRFTRARPEHVGMPAHELGDDAGGDVVEIEGALPLAQRRLKDDLKQEISELAA